MAPKATYPFIRFCGDYVTINRYISTGHFFIPNVRHELEKIINYPISLDIDLTNAFHQIRLDLDTAEKLSVQTPWGAVPTTIYSGGHRSRQWCATGDGEEDLW
jgi:hypothetical protein